MAGRELYVFLHAFSSPALSRLPMLPMCALVTPSWCHSSTEMFKTRGENLRLFHLVPCSGPKERPTGFQDNNCKRFFPMSWNGGRNGCQILVWTLQAWSDCMDTLPPKDSKKCLKIMFAFISFEAWAHEGQSCLKGMVKGWPSDGQGGLATGS